mmetsp:Transcript_46285/g.140242  ORF Transcript_46285/g.140242 Transcript_46285/m.140242 type:complete len:89 (-) Transcript_46285:418-684(-)
MVVPQVNHFVSYEHLSLSLQLPSIIWTPLHPFLSFQKKEPEVQKLTLEQFESNLSSCTHQNSQGQQDAALQCHSFASNSTSRKDNVTG